MSDEPPTWALAIAERLDRIEKALASPRTPPSPSDTLTRSDLRRLLRCTSDASLSSTLAALGVRSYVKGKYRRGDVENAVARASNRASRFGGPAL